MIKLQTAYDEAFAAGYRHFGQKFGFLDNPYHTERLAQAWEDGYYTAFGDYDRYEQKMKRTINK